VELHGVVRFSDGRPAPCVHSDLDGVPDSGAADGEGGWQAWGTTRSDGSFRVRELPRGRYVVEVSHDMAGPDFADHTTEPLTAGDDAVEIVVPIGVSVAGRVVDERGAGVEGVSVESTSALSEYDTKWATTDADGRFAVPAREGETYRVTAERNGLVSPEPVDVPGGKQDVVLRIETPPKSRGLAGVLVDEDGKPLAGTRIEARHPEDHRKVVGYDTTDADGRFAIEGLPDGAFRLELNDYDPRGLALVHGLFDRGTRGLRITARGTVAISGVVVDEDGRPVRNADVSISHELMDASYGCDTDAGGAFSMSDFPPRGGYVVSVEHEAFVDRAVTGVDAGGERLQIVLARGVELEGRIVGVDGAAVRRASFSLRLLDSDATFEVAAHTDDDGAFHVRGLRPGTYRVSVGDHGPAGPEEGVVAGRTGVVLALRR
jgi:protocatechuate 3,4-dioxygenase beta subunit